MAVEHSDWFHSTPSSVYLLAPSSDRVQEVGKKVIEECDDRDGVQARVSVDELLEYAKTEDKAFTYILREAKVGSRWGKDLLDYYKEFVESVTNSVDEATLEDELTAQFSKYDADPYESAFIGDAISLGFDLGSELSERLSTIKSSSVVFNRNDLAAALGYTIDIRDIDRPSVGTILIQFPKPFTELVDSQQLSFIPRVIQELNLLGLSVVMIGPSAGADESQQIEDFFRSVGRFELHELDSFGVTIPEEVNAWLETWYDRLCYDVDSWTISQDIARNATATAFDLKHIDAQQRQYTTHFVNAIEYGLQDRYSKQKLEGAPKDRFNELWDDVVKSHPNYDYSRSQRNSFPRVRVARQDGVVREFVLHHKGALLDSHLNGVPIQEDSEPSKALIDTIKTFLNAEQITEEQWSSLTGFVDDRLSDVTEISSSELVERMLLFQGSLPPVQVTSTESAKLQSVGSPTGDFDPGWYRKNWRTILSSYRVKSQSGLRLIEDKQELMDDIREEEGVSTTALYAKLERDVERAWDYYSSAVVEAVEAGVTDDIELDISESNGENHTEINIFARNTRLDREEEVEIEVYMPYRDVRVDSQSVSSPTISNTTDAILRSLVGVIGSQMSTSVDDQDELLYNLIVLYEETRSTDDRSLVYFDDLIEFCLVIPGIADVFRNAKQGADEGLRQALGSQELKQRLERTGSTYHRKGTDPYTGVEVKDNRYVAVELQFHDV